MRLKLGFSLSLLNQKRANKTIDNSTGETIFDSTHTRFCAAKIGIQWPPISFHLIESDVETNEKKYRYRSHGGWFMVLGALLPLIIPNCPFTWKIGLAVGTGAALLLNIITFILFQRKIKRILKLRKQQYQPSPVPKENTAPAATTSPSNKVDWNTDFETHAGCYAVSGVENNTVFSKDVYLALDSKKTMRNSNVFLVGDINDDARHCFAGINMWTQDSSFVVVDTDDTLLKQTSKRLRERGYYVQVLNLADITESDKYNPLDYCTNAASVESLSKVLLQNTRPAIDDPFVETAAIRTLQASILHVLHTNPYNKRTFAEVYNFVNTYDAEQIIDIFKREISQAFSKDEEACFSAATRIPPNMMKNVMFELRSRLIPFAVEFVQRVVNTSTIDLHIMQTDRKALFIIVPEKEPTNVLAPILISQLTHIAAVTGREGSRHLHFFINDIKSCGYIHDLCPTMHTARAHNMSISLSMSTIQQLSSIYPHEWESMLNACDTLLYFGLKDAATINCVAEAIHASGTMNNTKEDIKAELASLDEKECIVMIRGIKPFKNEKMK